MPLTGQINDLSLSELIELFCNRRKTGCLTVEYPQGTAQFYLKPGAIVHAAFADLNGVEAVHYALTLSNASFSFQSEVEAPEQSIDQPWTSVVLDGLRKIDEGVVAIQPSSNGNGSGNSKAHLHRETAEAPPAITSEGDDVKAFGVLLSQYPESAPPRRWVNLPVLVAIVLIVLGIGVPWGWYTRHKASQIRREADDKKFEHLYAPTESSPQPGAETPANGASKAPANQDPAKSPEKESESETESEKPGQPRSLP